MDTVFKIAIRNTLLIVIGLGSAFFIFELNIRSDEQPKQNVNANTSIPEAVSKDVQQDFCDEIEEGIGGIKTTCLGGALASSGYGHAKLIEAHHLALYDQIEYEKNLSKNLARLGFEGQTRKSFHTAATRTSRSPFLKKFGIIGFTLSAGAAIGETVDLYNEYDPMSKRRLEQQKEQEEIWAEFDKVISEGTSEEVMARHKKREEESKKTYEEMSKIMAEAFEKYAERE